VLPWGPRVSVTAPQGFRAAGVAAGLKSTGGKDLALVVNDGPRHDSASVFTANRCKANPVLWSQEVVKDGTVRAVVLNSGGANCYTGPEGFRTTHAVAERVAERLGIGAIDVVVCSTGLIGLANDRDALLAGIDDAHAGLSTDGGPAAAAAIMTTDSVSKQVVVEGAGWSIGGMAKGAGMLAPQLATMLVVLTTDAVVPAADLDAALRAATRVSFDRLDSDGCMSTNDTVTVMASGASGITPTPADFTDALTQACTDLAMQLLKDAEGADHEIAITALNAASEDEAVEVARSIARSNLFKAAVFGNDPNWGRVLASIGTTRAAFDPADLDVAMNGVWVCRQSTPAADPATVDLTGREVSVTVDLKAGDARATVWTNDLTHAYVHENSAYSS
jgi:glutamate N-acetyltransferase / amino-acid N-acetyltransferase